jgi:hypothetical protein
MATVVGAKKINPEFDYFSFTSELPGKNFMQAGKNSLVGYF